MLYTWPIFVKFRKQIQEDKLKLLYFTWKFKEKKNPVHDTASNVLAGNLSGRLRWQNPNQPHISSPFPQREISQTTASDGPPASLACAVFLEQLEALPRGS